MQPSSGVRLVATRKVHTRGIDPGLLLLLLAAAGCAGAIDQVVADAISAPATDVAARGGADPMSGDPQMLMTRSRPGRPGDAARAERIEQQVRRGIARYRDVDDAVAAGYRSFPAEPPPSVRIVHYMHHDRSQRELERIDPSRPGSLLYERTEDGGLRLIGAMLAAPVTAPLEELNRRVPLSVTQWHLHQNLCVPRPIWDKQKWGRTLPGPRPVFGPGSPITTDAACEAVAGDCCPPSSAGWRTSTSTPTIPATCVEPDVPARRGHGYGGGAPAPIALMLRDGTTAHDRHAKRQKGRSEERPFCYVVRQ